MFSSAIRHLNDRRSAAGETGEDAGFTLIELMVVLLILAILLAIAIPTFLGVTKSANDRAAQSNLNTALLNAKAQYQQNSQAYPPLITLTAGLQSAEPSLTFQAAASSDQNHISVFATADFAALVMTDYSQQTHNCWIVVDTPSTTAAVAPFAAAQGPVVAANTVLGPAGADANVAFADGTLGPTYAEIKGNGTAIATATLSAACASAQPVVKAGASYEWSTTAFPSIP